MIYFSVVKRLALMTWILLAPSFMGLKAQALTPEGANFLPITGDTKYTKYEWVYESLKEMLSDLKDYESQTGRSAHSDSDAFPSSEQETQEFMHWAPAIEYNTADLEGPCESFVNYTAEVFVDTNKGNIGNLKTDIIFSIEGVRAIKISNDRCSMASGLIYRSYGNPRMPKPVPQRLFDKIKN